MKRIEYFEGMKLRLENGALWGVKEFQRGFGKIDNTDNIGKMREEGGKRKGMKMKNWK